MADYFLQPPYIKGEIKKKKDFFAFLWKIHLFKI